MHRQVRLLTSEVTGLEEQLQAMRQSTSWRVSAPLRWLSRQLGRKASPMLTSPGNNRSYVEWVELYDTPQPEAPDPFCARMAGRLQRPSFSIVLAALSGQGRLLAASIDAVLAQDHANWRLVVAVEPELLTEVEGLLARDARAAARTKIFASAPRASKAMAFNGALEEVESDWVLFLEPGDTLSPCALSHFSIEIAARSAAGIILCDEDRLGPDGRRSDPCFKPAWNLDLFYAQDYVAGAAAFATALIREVGGFREATGEAAGYDLVLRCTERLRPEQIHRIPRMLWHKGSPSAATYPTRGGAAELRALAEHLERTGISARIAEADGVRHVQYALPPELPLVTLIIPTRNGLALLRQCVESIVMLTTYPNYEVLLVDNGSDEPDALAYMAELDGQPGIRLIRDDRPFNYSALNNMAARHARGAVLGLINNDIEVISPAWLEEMVSLAMQPGVGAVGAKLLYPDETVQHGGVLLGVGGATGVAGHANKFLPATEAGYMRRGASVQSFSAVTAACLVVRKSLYEQMGGLNEVELKIAYNDVDFCLRLLEAGYRNVWTPHAELFHHESATRGSDFSPSKRQRFDQEQDYMRSKWRELIADDPAYNPNLTVYAEDFGLAWPPRVPWITGPVAS
ncbi:glycosyltransferase family 2 protein [Variovorax sp. J22P271]|uniref:glycosyltransferase family 2 protein n=1 Tax=Variovorax davisae TaxID=3053515 RepID=UPI002575E70F|nr:glycosyltransferase family 2 protein [Variovorax sp. J22P271]MDM0033324.1 glycosyltransferase family 2 protein [Variovorax sp. J22P271]